MRRLLYLLPAALLAAALWWFTRPAPIAVSVQAVDRGSVEATVSNTRAGEVKACQRAKMSPIAGGRIDVLAVKEGDRVKKGQLLMRLWNEDQQADLRLARAQLESALRHENEACTTAANAAREARRTDALFAKGFVSSSRQDQAASEARARQANCAAAHADVAQGRARVGLAETAQTRTELVAPFDGTVADITGELGEVATPSPPGVPTPPAIDLIDDSCLYVTAPLDEVDAPRIHLEQSARITLDAISGRHFEGRVSRIAPYVQAIEKQARTVDVDVHFSHPEEARGLLVGYSADVEIRLDRRDKVLRIPTSALRAGQKVLVLGSDGLLQERGVKTGLANWEYIEILDGLAAGDLVVTSLEKEGVRAGVRARAERATEQP